MSTSFVYILLTAVSFGAISAALGDAPRELKRRFDLTLEQKHGDGVEIRDPTYVFAPKDLIRFHLRSSVNGFLYVVNQASSGKYQRLFPRDEIAKNRELTPSKDYRIPASGSGWFSIEDPPGYETVYFVIAPVDLGASLGSSIPQSDASKEAPPDPPAAAFNTATPRCDGELLRARGECLDSDAGLNPIQMGDILPDEIRRIAVTTARDFVFISGSKETLISSTEPFAQPAVYRFRIAHK